MAAEWTQASIGALCDAGVAELQTGPFGTQLHAYDYVDEGVPVVPTEAIRGRQIDHSVLPKITQTKAQELERHRLRSGDILFARRGVQATGHIGYVRAAEDGFICGTGAIRLRVTRASDEIDPDYLSHVLADPSSVEWFKFHAIGATMPNLNEGIIRSFPLAVPPFPEQRAIAHILGTLDDKIELNRRMNETLEAMARALFKSWFVDFDPVRAKAEGRDPGLPKPLADLFPARLVDSELGEIPEGWHVRTIEEIAERVAMGPFGASIKVETFMPDGVPIISGQHLRGFVLEDNAFNFITPDHAKRLANANVQRGDVVFTHAGNIGQVAFVPESSRYERYVISQRQFYMRCDRSQVSPTFIAFYFGSAEGRHRLLANTSSSGVPSIARPVTFLRTIPLTIPAFPVLAAFERQASPILGRFLKNVQINVTLTTLRDSLLPKLISGALRVEDVQSVVESA